MSRLPSLAFMLYFNALTRWGKSAQTESLRQLLLSYPSQPEFADSSDDYFRILDQAVDLKVDFIVAGHTRQPGALPRSRSRGWYLNPGTWIRQIVVQRELLETAVDFQQAIDALESGSADALDKVPRLLTRRRLVVAIIKDGESATGALLEYGCDGNTLVLKPVHNAALQPQI